MRWKNYLMNLHCASTRIHEANFQNTAHLSIITGKLFSNDRQRRQAHGSEQGYELCLFCDLTSLFTFICRQRTNY